MSLDNVLGVAAAAKGSYVLLIVGLGISIPLVVFGANMLLRLMERFPIIASTGAALLGYVAGEMAVTDPAVSGWVNLNIDVLHELLPIICAALIVIVGKASAAKKSKPSLPPRTIETIS